MSWRHHDDRYVVPLVFHHMLRRWTTVRPAVPHWPHRPLADAAADQGSAGAADAELQQVLIVDGVARSTEVSTGGASEQPCICKGAADGHA
jgi:hypothetical protein